MTQPAAIDEERSQLDAMIRLLPLEIDGEPTKRESPDFLLKLRDGRAIGVEVVRALSEQISKGRGTRTRMKQGVLQKLKAEGVNAGVNVRMHEERAGYLSVNKDKLRRETSAIVELARRTMGASPEERWYNYERIDRTYEGLIGDAHRDHVNDVNDLNGTSVEYADAVSIHPRDEPMVTWSSIGEGQPPSIVQDAIDDKIDKLATYRQCGADEIWLLVVGSAGIGGSLFVDELHGRVLVSPYDQTVFLELFEGKCVVLNTRPPTSVANVEGGPPA